MSDKELKFRLVFKFGSVLEMGRVKDSALFKYIKQNAKNLKQQIGEYLINLGFQVNERPLHKNLDYPDGLGYYTFNKVKHWSKRERIPYKIGIQSK